MRVKDADKILEVVNAIIVASSPHWIPCSEKLPTKSDTYLVSSNNNSVFNLYFSTEHGWDGWWNGRISAWMPLPKPYKESEVATLAK